MKNNIILDTSPSVLVVDDEVYILRSIKRLFMDADFDVITANSGREALRILEKNQNIVLIISDMCMPGMNGVELLEMVKDIVPDAARVLLTGQSDITIAVSAINRGGIHRYITKPWSEKELYSIIRKAFKRYRLLQENKKLITYVTKQNEQLREWNLSLARNVRERTGRISREYEHLKENYNSLLLAFPQLASLYDKVQEEHSKSVANISVKIAENNSLPVEDIEDIRIASLLHDTGKIALPSYLLEKKTEQMDSEEMEAYKLHPLRGEEIFAMVDGLEYVSVLIRHHHENFDGTGFPDGLRGNDIPSGARIIAIADLVERLMREVAFENRAEYVLNEIKNRYFTCFDPVLIEGLEEVLHDLIREKISLKRC